MLPISCMSQMVVFLNGWAIFQLGLLKLVNFKIHQINKVKRKRKIKETITKHFNLALVMLALGVSLLAIITGQTGREGVAPSPPPASRLTEAKPVHPLGPRHGAQRPAPP